MGQERRFERTIGIDYSGAETAEASLKGLRVYQTLGDARPKKFCRRQDPRNTGRAAVSRNGWLKPSMARRRLLSA